MILHHARPLARSVHPLRPLAACLALLALACAGAPTPQAAKGTAAAGAIDAAPWASTYAGAPQSVPALAPEVRLKDLRRLTFGGQNAEAYWSFGGKELILQSRALGDTCDRIYRLTVPAAAPGLAGLQPAVAAWGKPGALLPVTDGSGATTCAYFLPGDDEVIWASTHLGGAACPPKPDRSKGYAWALYDSYDIFKSKADGTGVVRLTDAKGYDAEATVCAKDGSIVFTSVRDGDLELYRMDRDGKNVKRLTRSPGYDGGAFFSPDCSKIVWRASRPRPGAELEEYQALLSQGLVKPSKLEIWIANADGSDAQQITWLDAASFAPFFHPSGKRVIFASNHGDPQQREFNLFAVDTDGAHLEQITFAPGFDGFPMFSPDGKLLVFASNRGLPPGTRESDVYLARWDEDATPVYLDNHADRARADVAFLADPAREGRGVGTAGLAAAGAFLEERFAALGLAPAGDAVGTKDGKAGYRQPFQVPLKVTVAEGTALELGKVKVPADQFQPLPSSSSADVHGNLVFAGYGIRAPDLGHDDWKGVDAKGKVALVRRFAPTTGKFERADLQRRHGDLRAKAFAAREAGAVALLIVDVPQRPEGAPADWKMPDEAAFPGLGAEGPGDAGLPILVVKRAAAQALLEALEKAAGPQPKLKMGVGQRWVLNPQPARVAVKLTLESAEAFNVAGRLSAGAPEKDRLPGVVVIGAHYDHLGFGGKESLAPGSAEAHLGADDNASGVAGLLEAVRVLSGRRAELRRDVVVVAFSGEEKGVLGSSHFARSPPAGLSIKDAVAMVNLDMVGRLRDNSVIVLGGDSAAEWAGILEAPCAAARLRCRIGGDGFGPSDQTPFFAAGVPVLHFFTGAHADYHKPSDAAGKVNVAGVVEIGRLAAAAALAVDVREGRLTYQSAPQPLPRGDLRSFNASLGVVPDYAGPPAGSPPGVFLAGVRPGGPAEKGGLQRGDLIVHLGPHQLRSVEDLMFALNASKPGETVTATLWREGKEVKLPVTFGEAASRR